MKKGFYLFLALIIVMFAFGYYRNYRSNDIPTNLRSAVRSDIYANASMLLLPGLKLSFMDRIIGHQALRYQVTNVEHLSHDRKTTTANQELCLQVRVIYRAPGSSSLYEFGLPVEEFLFHAWELDEQWAVEMIAKSGVDKKLNNQTCS